ncbi:MAG: carbamoyl-phosphate synthase large subunit [Alphaproteobacteria bacterium]|nr:carbamoyl-phosphate synthase large subunit [Alphaproteobacteria bacterium]
MPIGLKGLLIANRGEIAIRIWASAADMGIATVAVYAEDDRTALHVAKTDRAVPLKGAGPAAYLDMDQIIGAARDSGADAIHPGYGFLAENAEFARRCQAAGIRFVGPSPETLALFGDKGSARRLARQVGVPVLAGTEAATSLEEAGAFLAALGPGGAIMVKALAGGGGRGMRVVRHPDELEAAFARAASEARQAFGDGALYVEQFLSRARHVEVQVMGDRAGGVSHLWDRECSLQRQWQKLVEIAPAPGLSPGLRQRLLEAALALARAARLENIATMEFLVDVGASGGDAAFAFIEANARLQVEHTVSEAVTGVDLVRVQLDLAAGRSLADLGLDAGAVPPARGMAMQLRINMETMAADGTARPGGGTLAAYEPPTGPGIRVDGCGYAGYRASPRYDSLLAKLIVHTPSGDLAALAGKAYRALSAFKIGGVATNIAFLQNLLRHPDLDARNLHTGFVEEHGAMLAGASLNPHRPLFFEAAPTAAGPGVKVDPTDPLAVLVHGKRQAVALVGEADDAAAGDLSSGPDGTVAIAAPMQGTIVAIAVRVGESVRAGQELLVMEAMKMEHVIQAGTSGILRALTVVPGETVFEGHPLAFIEEGDVEIPAHRETEIVDLDRIRPDLAEVRARHALTLDASRPDSVTRRRRTQQRTARENVDDLCDPGSFVEYGSLVIAARRQRIADLDDLIRRTPADGLVTGIGRVNGHLFPDDAARSMVVAYDYTVLAGTQGKKNHQKKDRMFELAEKLRLPVILFTEGGGGRPGDSDVVFAGNLQTHAFHLFGRLSGLVPLIAVTSGWCFAGNAVLAGCCDAIIATANASIGMGGPAMIEGGGLGVFRPIEVGPMSVQTKSGVVDILVADEAAAVAAAKKYLSYFQGPVAQWTCTDQRLLRRLVPENRLRVYDVRTVIEALADSDSVLELRRQFGLAMITSLARVEGRPLGIIANNPMHLGGAIDSDAADKAARFMQVCDAFDIPILFLCDTPGNMVGPEAEKTGLVRHCCRVFVIGANLSVPFFTVVLRKAYGLGAQGMAGGGFHAPLFAVAWPTGEFGGMGLEGAIKLGYRNELAAIDDPAERRALYETMVARMYAQGKAINAASLFELDDVIDPAETRNWIMGALRAQPPTPPRSGKKRPAIDAW